MQSDRATLFVAALTVSACSASSVLIAKDDQIYERSRQRLERAKELVEADPAARPEVMMFLQAEALYRYRFEPPARSLGGYLAEGAAAAFDFPAFQSVA